MSTTFDDALDDVRAFVTGDGADIRLVERDDAHGRVTLRLDLSGVDCLECVIPPAMLSSLIVERFRKAGSTMEIVVEDPRELPGA
jgi:hypothetical protein